MGFFFYSWNIGIGIRPLICFLFFRILALESRYDRKESIFILYFFLFRVDLGSLGSSYAVFLFYFLFLFLWWYYMPSRGVMFQLGEVESLLSYVILCIGFGLKLRLKLGPQCLSNMGG